MGIAGQPSGGATDVADVFSTDLYDGKDSSQTINNGIDLAGEGGMVWQKLRAQNGSSDGQDHYLRDTVRGGGRRVYSNKTNGQNEDGGGISSFNSNGFSIGNVSAGNLNGAKYVTWTFRKKKKFFDIVTWTGNSVNFRSIAHNLNGPIGLIIVKRTNSSTYWATTHKDAAPLSLNSSAQDNNVSSCLQNGYIPAGQMSDTAFQTAAYNGNIDAVNATGGTYVAYVFADNSSEDADDQMIKCGSYTGNGSATGPIVNLGWEPQFVMIKRTTGAENWYMFDSMRGIATGGNDEYLIANWDGAADSPNNFVDLNSTGFQIKRGTTDVNGNNDSYIYMAIRAPMMVEPEAASDVFKPLARTGTNGTASVTGVGFPFDVLISRSRNNLGNTAVFSRITGPSRVLHTNESGAELNRTGKLTSFDQDGFSVGADNENIVNGSNNNYVYNAFKRAKGFFDVVTYTGDRSSGSRTVAHSLGVVPEMIWVKHTSLAQNWSVYTAATGGTKYGWLNANNEFGTSAGYFNNTNPTDSVFTVGNDSATNATNRPYIAYLFATLAGISKVGTFVSGGSGVTVNVDCGFSNGARFVLIKALTTDSWYFWDTARGIVSGNDSRLSLESTNAAVTNQDNIDPYSAGFSMNGTLIGNSGNTFIFYAIA